jgi:hypothetical protein
MNLHIKETKTTPAITIEEGKITIKGRSIPEDSAGFYNPVLEACEEYTLSPPGNTDIYVHLDYVNSGSKKYLTNMLTILERSYLKGFTYNIIWHYDEDDEAILDLGNDLKSIIKVPITLSGIEE